MGKCSNAAMETAKSPWTTRSTCAGPRWTRNAPLEAHAKWTPIYFFHQETEVKKNATTDNKKAKNMANSKHMAKNEKKCNNKKTEAHSPEKYGPPPTLSSKDLPKCWCGDRNPNTEMNCFAHMEVKPESGVGTPMFIVLISRGIFHEMETLLCELGDPP